MRAAATWSEAIERATAIRGDGQWRISLLTLVIIAVLLGHDVIADREAEAGSCRDEFLLRLGVVHENQIGIVASRRLKCLPVP